MAAGLADVGPVGRDSLPETYDQAAASPAPLPVRPAALARPSVRCAPAVSGKTRSGFPLASQAGVDADFEALCTRFSFCLTSIGD